MDTGNTHHLLWHNHLRAKKVLAIATDGTHLYYIDVPVSNSVEQWHGYLDSTDPEFERTELFDSYAEIAAAVKAIAPEQLLEDLTNILLSGERCSIGGNETEVSLAPARVIVKYDPIRQLKILAFQQGDTHDGIDIWQRFFSLPDSGECWIRPDPSAAMYVLGRGAIPDDALIYLLPEKNENRDDSLLEKYFVS